MRKETGLSMRWLPILGLVLALSACSSDQRELQAYIDGVKARPGQPIPPLPEVRPPSGYVYEAGDRRSPFIPDAPRERVNNDSGVNPDPNRTREFLEQEPLDALTMVGTLRDSRGPFGLIQDPQGRVHRVTIGNYMGQNHGRITGITESEIYLEEIVSDGLGEYRSRPAAIGLND